MSRVGRAENRKEKREKRAVSRVASPFLFSLFYFLFTVAGCFALAGPYPQIVVDRIVATVEGEPITASELADLGKLQRLTGGAAPEEKELLRRRIEQWIIATDARNSRFPPPQSAEIDREVAEVMRDFPSREAFEARLRELGLRQESLRQLLGDRLWLARHLDSRFRPTVQIDDAQIEGYYHGDLAKQMAARGQSLPPLDDVREQIREVLVQREISERAGRWLDESRDRIRVTILGGKKAAAAPPPAGKPRDIQ